MKKIFLAIISIAILTSCSKKEEPQKAKMPNDAVHQSIKKLNYTPNENWKEVPPSNSMRKSEYILSGKAGDAVMVVSFFPGMGGSVDANIERWYGQFSNKDGVKQTAKREDFEVNGIKVHTVYFTGTYHKSNMMGGPVEDLENYAMYSAIVESDQGPWFLKCTGPIETVNEHKDEIKEFFKSVKF